MRIVRKSIDLQSDGKKPNFFTVTDDVQKILNSSAIKNGFCVVYSHHTTCSIMIQESSFDEAFNGLEYLQQDLCDIFEKLVPTCRKEGQYMHPGPRLVEFAAEHGESRPETLNTDAHLRSALLGRSETVIVIDGKLDLGQFGNIYFIDFDTTRPRKRTAQVQIIGE